jgi:hypothetical protein
MQRSAQRKGAEDAEKRKDRAAGLDSPFGAPTLLFSANLCVLCALCVKRVSPAGFGCGSAALRLCVGQTSVVINCIVPAESLSKDGKGLHRYLVMRAGESEFDSITV